MIKKIIILLTGFLSSFITGCSGFLVKESIKIAEEVIIDLEKEEEKIAEEIIKDFEKELESKKK